MVNALSFKSQQKCIPLINATNAVRLCSLHCHIFTSAPNFAETHYLTSRAVQRETVFCWLTMKYEHESTSMSPNSTIENCCRKGDWCKQRLGISTTRGSPFLAPSTSTFPGRPSQLFYVFFILTIIRCLQACCGTCRILFLFGPYPRWVSVPHVT